MPSPPPILRLALPSPLRRCFDYRLPEGESVEALAPGQRIRVPFGNRQLVGLLLEVSDHTDVPTDKLRPALERLDETPILPPPLLKLARWAASYYQHPPGDAMLSFLPTLLRKGEADQFRHEQLWVAEPGETADLGRAAKQQALLEAVRRHPQGISNDAIRTLGFSAGLVRALAERGLIRQISREQSLVERAEHAGLQHEPHLPLNAEQQRVVDEVGVQLQGFHCTLLQGVTGSGKTEVYLQLIGRVLEQGGQALVLVPEIGLTPQTVGRFRRRFNVPVELMHSGLNDRERLDAWLRARDGQAGILIGTRSAVLTPLKRLGIIVIDEEHDGSFKQQDGFRYSARDLAVMRAREEGVPILLGSATPSLESLHNAMAGRYRWLHLRQRAGGAAPPKFERLDICHQPLEDGLSTPLVREMRVHLERGEQVLVFLNRRGFAPTLMCHDCGWIADCPQCDAHMTLHRRPPHLHCHHCDYQAPLRGDCPKCASIDLNPVGAGTERSEEALKRLFPKVPVIRVDRDSTRRKDAMEKILKQVHEPGSCILVGTQMLAKGHHFPRVTLVAILDADAGLFSGDFRGMEKMAQLLLQVAGRAGRADRPGRVIMQTHHADHPRLQSLTEDSYEQFAQQELQERRAGELPPYTHYALLRAEAVQAGRGEAFLQLARNLAEAWGAQGVGFLGPLPSPMERRAGRYRAQLLLQSGDRRALHRLVGQLALALEQNRQASKVRWSVDIDPLEMY